jgi:hypothetical protein
MEKRKEFVRKVKAQAQLFKQEVSERKDDFKSILDRLAMTEDLQAIDPD